ncbi:ABC transporter ATP-binding protein [Parageobacillus thermoglucosidasius]|uniref:ABC transporter ATP-binding protein n=1 Tax=Parageobacillus thermoglucosidasius TaxID=1426 RepID=UPI000B586464|nr:ABC transporter ATP-binding protein [Parageobacillus thermoglucosidasius]OUM85389.1 MAG: ABC transporter ATP-binding protein [Parageobacillus thermoglucosidasius]
MKKIIIGENIVKSFGVGNEKQIVLDGVSVCINEGEFVSVMGPSGSGKSTLLYALSGMDSIDSGQVFFDGKDLSALSEKELSDLRRTKMGFIFQQPTFLKNLNILDNIILPSMRNKRKSAKEIIDKAKKLMKKVGIAGLEKRDFTQVSGGQLQRAEICRALMSDPKIIFGDEPTGALNSKSAQEIMDLISDINTEGTAVLLVTHDAKVAARTERIMFMLDGNIVSQLELQKFNGADLDGRIKKVTEKMQEIGI